MVLLLLVLAEHSFPSISQLLEPTNHSFPSLSQLPVLVVHSFPSLIQLTPKGLDLFLQSQHGRVGITRDELG